MQTEAVQIGGAAVLRDGGELAENQAAQRIVILVFGEREVERVVDIFERRTAADAPSVVARTDDFRFGLLVKLVVDIADDFFQQVLHRDDAAHAAVLIHDNRHVDFFHLHVAEELVSLHCFRHEVCLAQQRAQGFRVVGLGIEQEVACVEDADDVVHVFVVDGEAAQTGIADGAEDFVLCIIHPDAGNVGAVGHDLFGSGIVELEDVFDHFLFRFLNRAVFAADVHHHADVVLGHFVLSGVGVNAAKAEDAVRGGVQQHHERAENHRADLQQEQRTARNRFGILHREALGHECSQTERQVGKKERN